MRKICLGILLSAQFSLGTIYYQETFDPNWESRWTHSSANPEAGKFKLSAGKFFGDSTIDKGIQTSQDAKFYAISAPIEKSFSNENKDLVVQFSVKHEQNIDCGGGYLKVLPSTDPAQFKGDSLYHIMFGPDICGATKKIHFILHYKGQNLLWKKEPLCETDTLSHTYTAILKADKSYEVLVDFQPREKGTLEEDWEFLKPKTIPDPSDEKPEDWVDEPEMDDPEDKKPDDWDTAPATIADPDATQPEDWDEEEDGKWEAPMISNPAFKGEWRAKKIPHPGYKGPWKPKDIPNPEYVEDSTIGQFSEIAAVGFDLWQVKSGTIFDSIIITDSVDEAKAFYDVNNGATKDAEKKAFDDAEVKERKEEEEKRKKEEDNAKKDAEEDEDDEEDDEEEEKDEL